MRSKDLVAGADEMITIQSLHIDESVRGVVNAIESNLCTRSVRQPGDSSYVDNGTEGVGCNGTGDEASR